MIAIDYAAREERNDCKGCRASVQTSSGQIEKLLSKIKAEHRVSDELYARRLEACRSCASLSYGTTCMQCGCFVEVRAVFKDKSCPHPNANVRERWTFIPSEEEIKPC